MIFMICTYLAHNILYIFSFLSNVLFPQLEFKSLKFRNLILSLFLFPTPNLILEFINKYLLVSKDG